MTTGNEPGLYDIDVTTIDGKVRSMADYRGHTLLIVNVASRCGYTPQYAGLEELYQRFRDRGLLVLGFPCNQFGRQEPGTDEEIASFCGLNYGVTFPMFSKIDVNGPGAHPLFRFLKGEKKGVLGTEAIKWNFTKFLVSPSGEVLKRYAPADSPDKIAGELERQLPASS